MLRISERTQNVSVSELFRKILRLYQNHLSLFWKVVIPVFLLSLLLDMTYFSGINYISPESSWKVKTSDGITVTTFVTQTYYISVTSLIYISLWFAMSILTLITYNLYQGNSISTQEVLQQTYHRKSSIFGAGLLCIVALISLIVSMLVLSSFLGFFLFIIGFFSVLIYFGVRLSLIHQAIMIEDLSAVSAFLRSSELVSGKWFKFFARFLSLTWISSLILNLTLAFTLFILSFVSTDLVPIRESMLSGEFLTLFFGIPISFHTNDINVSVGNISMSFSETPSLWIIAAITIVKTFVYALLTPIWAILTTHLYLEQTDGEEISGETQI